MPIHSLLFLVFVVCPIHLYWLWIIIYTPNTTWADTGTNTTAYAAIRIGNIGPGTVLVFDTGNRFFRARLQAHLTIPASSAADAPGVIILRVTQLTVMTFGKIGFG